MIFFASFVTPTITQLDPAEKQNKVTFNAPFTLHFSHVMHRGSVEDAFTLLPKTDGSFRWKDLKTLEFIPDEPLAIGDEYRIVINGEAKSIWMKHMVYDTTIDYLVTGPPYVLFVDPPQGSVLTKDGVITVMFDRPMDFDGTNESDLLQAKPSLSVNVEFFSMSAFQFIPKNLASGQTYELTIPAGLSAIDGGTTDEGYSWMISTPDLKVEKSSPETEAKGVAVNESIRIHFDGEVPLEGIKPGINALLFPSNDLDADTTRKIDGFFNTEVTYAVNEEGESQKDILVFTPTFDYQPGEDYLFILKNSKDIPLEYDFELEFETAEATEEDVEEGTGNDEEVEINEGDETIEFFIRGENPRLKLDKALSEPAILSACQIPSNEFIRVSARHGWDKYECDTNTVKINPHQDDSELIINLNDHFNINWVTGVYFASITQGEKKTVRHFLIEDSVLLMKRSDSDLFIWALDVKSGEPISEMELEILNYDGEEVARGKTDEMGTFNIEQAFDAGMYVRAKKEAKNEDDGINRWGFVSDRWSLADDKNVVSHEDSGLYVILNQYVFAPGDSIQTKGIWRSFKDHILSIPESTQITVIIEDIQHNIIVSKRIPMRRNGSFDGTITIPTDSASGYYMVSVADLNHQRLASPIPIQVRDSASDLRLEWIEAKSDHVAGMAPIYIAKARYENGISAAKVKGYYELFRKPSSQNYQNGAISFAFSGTDEVCTENCKERTLVTREDFEFDSNGEAKLLLTDGEDKFLSAGYDYYLQITSLLPGGEPTSNNSTLQVHKGGIDKKLG